MIVTMDEVDVLDLLSLERLLSEGEIGDVIDVLAKEMWYRFLEEELPKLIGKEAHRKLLDAHKMDETITPVLKEIDEKWPNMDVDTTMAEVTRLTKADFMSDYIDDIASKKKGYPNLKQFVDEFKKEIYKKELSTKTLAELKTKFYRLATWEAPKAS